MKTDTIESELSEREKSMAESFETYRAYLFSIAYRMLGSAMDAEDMVQETYLRYQAAPHENIVSLKAYLTTILTRLSIDQLQRAYRQRETYIGPWLPEPIPTNVNSTPNAEEDMVMRESLSLAFLVLLEELQPTERAVFLLREVFDYDYVDIATFVGKSEAACRQIFSRVRKRLADRRPNAAPTVEIHRELLNRYIQAVQAGDSSSLMDLLAEDVTLVADGGGKIREAATHPLFGRAEVARFSIAVGSRLHSMDSRMEMIEVNGQPAILVRAGEQVRVVMTIEAMEGKVNTVRFMANPDKLAHL